MSGSLFLIPVPLGPVAPESALPAPALEQVRALTHFIAEDPKSARRFLKALGTTRPLQSLAIETLNEHTRPDQWAHLIAPMRAGHDMGLLSEAGCPAVADPGADLVALAHQSGFRVVPLIGPSSLVLALMASGLNGQCFAFHGYLPARDEARERALRALEETSRQHRQTQIFIETPYRNLKMLHSLLRVCRPQTRLSLAIDLSLPGETVLTQSIAAWKKNPLPELERRPAVFLLLG